MQRQVVMYADISRNSQTQSRSQGWVDVLSDAASQVERQPALQDFRGQARRRSDWVNSGRHKMKRTYVLEFIITSAPRTMPLQADSKADARTNRQTGTNGNCAEKVVILSKEHPNNLDRTERLS